MPATAGKSSGKPSPYPWPVPVLRRNVATKPELRGHFDPLFADFKVEYPDQLRVDEFLAEFEGFVSAQKENRKAQELTKLRFVAPAERSHRRHAPGLSHAVCFRGRQ